MPPKCKIGRSGGCTGASAAQIGRNWRTKILEIFIKDNLAQVRRAPCTGDIGNFLSLDPNLRILKQDALGNISGIWVLLVTMASLHVGLYSSMAKEELSWNLLHGLNSTNGFLVDVLVKILALGMHRIWQFHRELQVSMLVLKGDKEKHCQLLRQGFFSEESDAGCQSMDMYIVNSTKDGFGGDQEYCFWENYGAHAHAHCCDLEYSFELVTRGLTSKR